MKNSVSQQNTFKESKKEIIKIFKKLSDYVNDSDEFLRSIHNSGAVFQALINADDEKSLSKHVERVKGIQSIISRDNMKCAFFGSTSNGKSTTINALLGDSILPAGVGQTTSCFIKIRGTKDSQGSASIKSSSKPGPNSPPAELVGRKNIDSVLERARDSCKNKLPTDSLIRIAWPSQKCALLSEDVVILDCPGINLKHDIDQCIDEYCQKSDVFVLVVNSVSALNETEKDFFHKVYDRLSKPNVFILNNYWDKSVKDPNHVKIREKHMERSVKFLTKELKVCSKTEAENRVFFVSAKEALSKPSKKNKCEPGAPTRDFSGTKPLREGWEERQSDFTVFKESLMKTLSGSATKTKFAAHSSQGQDIVRQVRCLVEVLNKNAKYQKDEAVRDRNEMQTRCSRLESLLRAAHYESTADISRVSDEVSKLVAEKLHKEVQNLDDVINKFNEKFSDEKRKLDQYKIDLSKHVEDHFHKIMKEFWDSDLRKQVEDVKTAILERYLALVRDADVSKAMIKSECVDYVQGFDIDCKNMSSDFHEDLSCQFSLDLKTDMISLFTVLSLVAVPLPIVRLASAAAFVTGCGVSIMRYLNDYSNWTMDAKEKAFKEQFRSYMAEELEPLIALTSKYSAKEATSALKNTLEKLDDVVKEYDQKLLAKIAQLKSDIQRLEEIVVKCQNLMNTTLALEKELKDFHDKYIFV